jgi:hypothetical protein
VSDLHAPAALPQGPTPWYEMDFRLRALFITTKLIPVTERIAVPKNDIVPNSEAQNQNILPHELWYSEMLLQSDDYCGHAANTNIMFLWKRTRKRKSLICGRRFEVLGM